MNGKEEEGLQASDFKLAACKPASVASVAGGFKTRSNKLTMEPPGKW